MGIVQLKQSNRKVWGGGERRVNLLPRKYKSDTLAG